MLFNVIDHTFCWRYWTEGEPVLSDTTKLRGESDFWALQLQVVTQKMILLNTGVIQYRLYYKSNVKSEMLKSSKWHSVKVFPDE